MASMVCNDFCIASGALPLHCSNTALDVTRYSFEGNSQIRPDASWPPSASPNQAFVPTPPDRTRARAHPQGARACSVGRPPSLPTLPLAA